VTRLERELDQIYIGNMKLYVNIPRYSRPVLDLASGPSREVKRLYHPKPTFDKTEEVRMDKNGNEGC